MPDLVARNRGGIERDLVVWMTATLLGAISLSVAGRYDTFRNELYFIACGRHPAFGYADLPPLVPLIAATTQLFGEHTWMLRLPAIAAGVGLVFLTAAFARTLGGDKTAEGMAAIAVAIAPVLIVTNGTLSTETFEPITWTACAYLLVRGLLNDDRRSLMWAGIVAGVGLEAKYGIGIWIIALAIGVIATPARRILSQRSLWIGALIGIAIALPSFIWQTMHGWPFLQSIRYATGHRNLTGSPIRFEIAQILAMDWVLAPLWIAGVVAPFRNPKLGDARFVSIAFVAATFIVFATHGKDYYLVGAYPAMFAVGAVACSGLNKWLRRAWFATAVLSTVLIAPVVLPILDPPSLARFLDRTHLRPRPNEVEAIGAPLTQLFSDELGWRVMEKQVAAVYQSLPREDRARAAIIASNYGEAAALDVYGSEDHLPPAVCPQLQYYLWGTHGYDGSIVIQVNGDPEIWKQLCQSAEVVGHIGAPYVMPYENGPIILCRGMRPPLDEIWPRLRRYH